MKKSKIAILGQGYVGLPLAIAAQSSGWQVTGIDIDQSRISQLKRGVSYIEDVSDVELQGAIKEGFTPSHELSDLAHCEIIVICVPTPLSDVGQPDLDAIKSASEAIANYASEKALIINESTSYPGTIREFIPSVIRKSRPNSDFLYSVAPERVDPANLTWNYQNTPRLISGLSEAATKKTYEFYSSFCDKVIVVSSPEVAEFSKLLENSFRLVNIALVNELVPLAKALNVDIFEVIRAADTKPYGFMKFLPGIGVGGHCIPVDPMYLSWTACEQGLQSNLIDTAHEINSYMPLYVSELVRKRLTNTKSKILVTGLSYKTGVVDIRESPSVKLVKKLQSEFENVSWWDEKIKTWNNQVVSRLEEDFEIVVVTQKVSDSKVLEVIHRTTRVIDCTGTLKGLSNVETF